MSQGLAWEREYQHPQLVSKEPEPQADIKRYFSFLKKEQGVVWDGLRVLDVGCGTGRNANALAEYGARVAGMDIAPTAIRLAQERARALGVTADYRVGDMGEAYPFEDASFDVVLDVTSSNSLNERERAVYLNEVFRVLAPGGQLFVRALCKEGDKHAKNLMRQHPGGEKDTYRMEALGLTERVFTEVDFRQAYGAFRVLRLLKKANYARFQGRPYKRQYWLAYLQKPGHTTEV
jgi:ubiquinone/menaquinone biosynthesis C-methylase UbiE